MKSLEDFLSLPDVEGLETEVFVSKRLGNFKISALTASEHAGAMQKAKKFNKKGELDFDNNLFNSLIISSALISPDFSNADFLKKAKCNTSKDFIAKKLLPGEIQELANQILAFSGFDIDANEATEEAKN